MKGIRTIINQLDSDHSTVVLSELYGESEEYLIYQRQRYRSAINTFQQLFPGENTIELFSTPGRTEVGGNHTDHNSGRVLAAAVNLDVLAVVSENKDNKIIIHSQGFPPIEIEAKRYIPDEKKYHTSTALIKGICSRFLELGYVIGGFNAYITSDVLMGSGLSSSAAFEVLIVTILNDLYNSGQIDEVEGAKIAQYSENTFFGKPCGLMDQSTCAVGGFVTIDFKDLDQPVVQKIKYDFSKEGYSLVIVDTGGNHANLNEDYTLLEDEMKQVAHAFGKKVLRECNKKQVLENIQFLRTQVNDRAILRAIHFFDDDNRVMQQINALENHDFEKFKKLIIASGYSSWMYCQNCYSCSNVHEQGIGVALAVTEDFLAGKGAWRLHGGGFAGTIQVFVPNSLLKEYLTVMKKIFGEKSCFELIVRGKSTTRVGL